MEEISVLLIILCNESTTDAYQRTAILSIFDQAPNRGITSHFNMSRLGAIRSFNNILDKPTFDLWITYLSKIDDYSIVDSLLSSLVNSQTAILKSEISPAAVLQKFINSNKSLDIEMNSSRLTLDHLKIMIIGTFLRCDVSSSFFIHWNVGSLVMAITPYLSSFSRYWGDLLTSASEKDVIDYVTAIVEFREISKLNVLQFPETVSSVFDIEISETDTQCLKLEPKIILIWNTIITNSDPDELESVDLISDDFTKYNLVNRFLLPFFTGLKNFKNCWENGTLLVKFNSFMKDSSDKNQTKILSSIFAMIRYFVINQKSFDVVLVDDIEDGIIYNDVSSFESGMINNFKIFAKCLEKTDWLIKVKELKSREVLYRSLCFAASDGTVPGGGSQFGLQIKQLLFKLNVNSDIVMSSILDENLSTKEEIILYHHLQTLILHSPDDFVNDSTTKSLTHRLSKIINSLKKSEISKRNVAAISSLLSSLSIICAELATENRENSNLEEILSVCKLVVKIKKIWTSCIVSCTLKILAAIYSLTITKKCEIFELCCCFLKEVSLHRSEMLTGNLLSSVLRVYLPAFLNNDENDSRNRQLFASSILSPILIKYVSNTKLSKNEKNDSLIIVKTVISSLDPRETLHVGLLTLLAASISHSIDESDSDDSTVTSETEADQLTNFIVEECQNIIGHYNDIHNWLSQLSRCASIIMNRINNPSYQFNNDTESIVKNVTEDVSDSYVSKLVSLCLTLIAVHASSVGLPPPGVEDSSMCHVFFNISNVLACIKSRRLHKMNEGMAAIKRQSENLLSQMLLTVNPFTDLPLLMLFCLSEHEEDDLHVENYLVHLFFTFEKANQIKTTEDSIEMDSSIQKSVDDVDWVYNRLIIMLTSNIIPQSITTEELNVCKLAFKWLSSTISRNGYYLVNHIPKITLSNLIGCLNNLIGMEINDSNQLNIFHKVIKEANECVAVIVKTGHPSLLNEVVDELAQIYQSFIRHTVEAIANINNVVIDKYWWTDDCSMSSKFEIKCRDVDSKALSNSLKSAINTVTMIMRCSGKLYASNVEATLHLLVTAELASHDENIVRLLRESRIVIQESYPVSTICKLVNENVQNYITSGNIFIEFETDEDPWENSRCRIMLETLSVSVNRLDGSDVKGIVDDINNVVEVSMLVLKLLNLKFKHWSQSHNRLSKLDENDEAYLEVDVIRQVPESLYGDPQLTFHWQTVSNILKIESQPSVPNVKHGNLAEIEVAWLTLFQTFVNKLTQKQLEAFIKSFLKWARGGRLSILSDRLLTSTTSSSPKKRNAFNGLLLADHIQACIARIFTGMLCRLGVELGEYSIKCLSNVLKDMESILSAINRQIQTFQTSVTKKSRKDKNSAPQPPPTWFWFDTGVLCLACITQTVANAPNGSPFYKDLLDSVYSHAFRMLDVLHYFQNDDKIANTIYSSVLTITCEFAQSAGGDEELGQVQKEVLAKCQDSKPSVRLAAVKIVTHYRSIIIHSIDSTGALETNQASNAELFGRVSSYYSRAI
eukprot:GHVL01022059.1.p1 GENE.GHVL01022059.1~~GHVL01022059.1.p1  ORF type:complete len:1743 (-),score=268.65 GHVL01022059.1:154-4707(-)